MPVDVRSTLMWRMVVCISCMQDSTLCTSSQFEREEK
jgi:hypothetical protein